MTDASEPTKPLTNSKVGRLIEDHDLTGLGETLERRWLGEGTEQQSLRDLAEFFNKELLAAVMYEAGVNTIEGELDNLYRLLTDDDVSSGNRTQARNRLKRNDIDVEELEREFVTHQAVHTYLTEFRGVSRDDRGHRSLEADERTLTKLRNRTATVTESVVEQRSNRGDISLDEFDVLVDVRILCRDCGSQYTVGELFEQGGCDCSH
jgi:hypothetical protein